jgi:proteasome component ECM29
LYRYQFDPVSKIQVSMASIWNALVQDSTKTIDQYLPHIMDELIANLTNPQWRIREACCGAIQVRR